MNILRKFWQWLCRFASDSWRILQREIAERKQDIASITKVELQQIAKTEGKHFFLGGLSAFTKRQFPCLPFKDNVKVGYEDCFEAGGIQPIAALGRCLNSFWRRLAGNYHGSPAFRLDFVGI